MATLQAALVAFSLLGASDTVLVDFSADWCGPCRQMEPTVNQLMAAGYPIRKVNIDRERELAALYHVQSIPCFVLLVDGQLQSGLQHGPRLAPSPERQQEFAQEDPRHHPIGLFGDADFVVWHCLGPPGVRDQRLRQAEPEEFVLGLLLDKGLKTRGTHHAKKAGIRFHPPRSRSR